MGFELYEEVRKKMESLGLMEDTGNYEDVLLETSKLILNNSYDMISLLDKDSNPIYLNKAHKRILGYEKEDLLNKPALENFHPKDIEKAKKEWSTLIKTKEDRDKIVGRYKAKDGSYIWMETHLKTLMDKDNNIALVLCISRDISDRIEAENRLKKNKEKIEKLHDVAYELDSCRTEKDAAELIVEASETILNFDYVSLFKITDDTMESLAFSFEIEPKIKKNIYSKDNYTWQTFLSGNSFLVKDIESDDRAKAGLAEFKSGISIPIEDYGVFQALSKEKNRYDHDDLELAELLISHMSQAVKRMNYETKLKQSEVKYRSIFENTGTATIIINEDTTISLMNKEAERLVGYDKSEVEKEMSFKDFLIESDVEKIDRFHRLRRQDPSSVPEKYETKLVTKYGDLRDVIVNVGMMNGSKKSVASLIDITHIRKNTKALREIEESFRVAFDNSIAGMMRLDKDLKILEVNENACKLLDKNEKELLGEDILGLFTINNQNDLKKGLERALDGETVKYDSLKYLSDKTSLKMRIDPITNLVGDLEFLLLQFI